MPAFTKVKMPVSGLEGLQIWRTSTPARHDIETLVGLDELYAIEEETVEETKLSAR